MRVTAAPVPRHRAVTPSCAMILRAAPNAATGVTDPPGATSPSRFTWNKIFTRSIGAVRTLDNAPAAPPATSRSIVRGSGACLAVSSIVEDGDADAPDDARSSMAPLSLGVT